MKTLVFSSVHRAAVVATVWLALATAHLGATEVTMANGQVFVGEMVSKTDAAIVLDTKFGTGRARLTIPRDRIAKLVEGPVPEGFFDPPKAAPRTSSPTDFAPTDQLYLEVPITGRFGESVFASGIERVVAYARRYRIPHLVFVVDSHDSANIDEARKAFRVLERAKGEIACHAVVRQATGDSIGLLIPCDTIHVMPGARIGGAPVTPREGESAEELAVMLRQLAQTAGEAAERLHRPGPLVRAMIDPTEELSCWLDEAGEPELGVAAPANLPADRLIFACPRGEVLALTFEQLQRLSLPVFRGSVAELGGELGLAPWKAESDYGQKAMATSAEQERAALQAKERAFARRAELIIGRRNEARDALQHDLAQAARWDPEKGKYATYQSGGRWTWRSISTWGPVDTRRMTTDSRRRWAQRTDVTVRYIGEALKVLKVLKAIEKHAADMGIEPLFAAGHLDRMENDLGIRRKALILNRDRRDM